MLCGLAGEAFFLKSFLPFEMHRQKSILALQKRADTFALHGIQAVVQIVDNLLAVFKIAFDDGAAEKQRTANAPDGRLELEGDDAEDGGEFGEFELIGLQKFGGALNRHAQSEESRHDTDAHENVRQFLNFAFAGGNSAQIFFYE